MVKEAVKVSKATLKKKPLEFSCRAPVAPPKPRTVLIKGREKPRDPRFDSVSGGEFDAYKCAQAYSFIDDLRAREREALLQAKGGKHSKNDEIDSLLEKMDSQDSARKRMTDFINAKSELRRNEKQQVAQTGKTPFFHSAAQVKQKVLEGKYKQLQKSGKVEAEISKRRKHQDSKEKKQFIPKTRRTVYEDSD